MQTRRVHIKELYKPYPAFTAILLLFCLISPRANGQSIQGLKETVIAKFNNYIKLVPREEVYVNTDRDSYLPGETLWFGTWLINRRSMLTDTMSRIVYFEILNPDNRPVVQRKIGIANGFGNSQAELPDSLSTGVYLVRAYTNRMKNFMPGNCFYKYIQIYNPDNTKRFSRSAFSDQQSGPVTNTSVIPAKNDSIIMVVDQSKTDLLEIFIKTDADQLISNGNRFLLFIQTHGVISFAEYENITTDGIKVIIPGNRLTAGIAQITLFNPIGIPVCEKYIFIPVKENKKAFAISSDSVFSVRDKVTIGLTSQFPADTILINGNFSVSVTQVADNKLNIQLPDYLLFGSEYNAINDLILKGQIPDYHDQVKIRDLLGRIKSNWIEWDRILSDTIPRFRYPFEKETSELGGSIVQEDGKAGRGGKMVWLSVPGKVPVFKYAITDSVGHFSFPMPADDDLRSVVLQPADKSDSSRIRIDSPFSDVYPTRSLISEVVDKKAPDYISEWSVANQVRKIYEIPSYEISTVTRYPRWEPLRFYGKPDEEIILDDFIKLPVMEEVFFEIVKFVTLRKKRTGYEMSVIDPEGLVQFNGPPTSFVDGVIINDPDKIAAIDPDKVEKIDVVLKQYIVGDYIFNGIINVITRKGDFSGISLPEQAVRHPFRAIDQVMKFRSPDYSSVETSGSRIPDLRNTLFWEPGFKPDKGGKQGLTFWTADQKSDYVINIQGITTDGRQVSVSKVIHVK